MRLKNHYIEIQKISWKLWSESLDCQRNPSQSGSNWTEIHKAWDLMRWKLEVRIRWGKEKNISTESGKCKVT